MRRMATITTKDETKVFQIKKFLGINESSDGDTQFKMGEASRMDNWRVTPQYHLQIRPGLKTIRTFSGPVRGLWSGRLSGEDWIVCAAGGNLWAARASACSAAAAPLAELANGFSIGRLADDRTTFFGFGNKLYLLNGHEYLSWDGNPAHAAAEVEGYIPLVITAASPSGGGTKLENINRLTPKRRARFSADGESRIFYLPEHPIAAVTRVEINGAAVQSGYLASIKNGEVQFETAPGQGVDNVEIWYEVRDCYRDQVTAMRFCETFNGDTDTRVFLYGDGTNKTIYSGITETGVPSAEYFPDLFEIAVDSENTPITGMVKQFSYLMIFKPDGAFSTQYSAVTLTDGSVTAGFYVSPINREIGHEVPGQVRAVYNFPRTLYAGNVYDWQTVTTGRDERRAKKISERITKTLHSADLSGAVTFDNERDQEYYIFLNDVDGTVLVHRYSYGGTGDVWYRYQGIPATAAVRVGDAVYLGLSDGRLCDFSTLHQNDDGETIPCRWESGNMDFGYDFRRKYSSLIWVSLKPDVHARITVTAHTDRRTTYTEKLVPAGLATFTNVDFRHFSFITNRNPQMERVKLKVKKFAFYKLVLYCDEDYASTTVLGVDIRVRYTGFVK